MSNRNCSNPPSSSLTLHNCVERIEGGPPEGGGGLMCCLLFFLDRFFGRGGRRRQENGASRKGPTSFQDHEILAGASPRDGGGSKQYGEFRSLGNWG